MNGEQHARRRAAERNGIKKGGKAEARLPFDSCAHFNEAVRKGLKSPDTWSRDTLDGAEMVFCTGLGAKIGAVARLMDELTSPDSRGDAGLLASRCQLCLHRSRTFKQKEKNE